MTPTPPPIDIVTVAIALASAFFSAELALVIGPYAVILLSAIGGASWSLASRVQTDTRNGLVHMACMVGLAMILTVPAAEGLARMLDLNVRWMLAPVAAVIAARPDWVIDRIRAIIERTIGQKGEQP